MNTLVPSLVVAWLLVAASGAFEVVFSVLLKQTDGFTRPIPSVIAVTAALLSIWLMTISLRTLPLGPTYAVWAGIGTLGTAILATILYAEPVTLSRTIFMLFVIVGIIGLQLQGID